MLIESTPSDSASTAESDRGVAARRAVRILVVDDNADAADLLGEALQMSGYEVRVVYDGHSAITLAASFLPVLALLDIGLPGMNGFELSLHLRALAGLEALKCVAITGYGHPDDRRRSAESGFQAHILKPVDMEALEREMERILK